VLIQPFHLALIPAFVVETACYFFVLVENVFIHDTILSFQACELPGNTLQTHFESVPVKGIKRYRGGDNASPQFEQL
jgi:hypothetical protein